MARYCSQCGFALSGDERYCPDCGEAVVAPDPDSPTEGPTEADRGAGPDRSGSSPSRTADQDRPDPVDSPPATEPGDPESFRVAIWASLAWLVAVLVVVTLSLGAGSGARGYGTAIGGIAWIAWFVSLVAMYDDLRSLEEPLWDTRPILWVLAGLLVYVVAIPLYYTRRRSLARDQAGAGTPPSPADAGAPGDDAARPTGNQSAYRFAVGAAIFSLVVLVVEFGAVGPGQAGLAVTLDLVVILAWVAGVLGMFVDLRDMDERLGDGRPGLWVFGALVLFPVVFPVYVYLRRQATRSG